MHSIRSLIRLACGVLGLSLASQAAVAATSLVAVAPLPTYTVSSAEIILNGTFTNQTYFWILADPSTAPVASELRSGGKALRVNSWAGQKLAANTLQAGKSYALTVKARRTTTGGTAYMSVVFRDRNTVLYRQYKRSITSTSNGEYVLKFTAPAYTASPEVSFSVSGTQVIVDSVSLQMIAPLPQTEPVTALYGSYVPAGYRLVFNDEFDGTSLDQNKWFTRYIYDGATRDHVGDEQQRYRDNNNVVVSGGFLNLIARKVSNDPSGINYESGMVRSDWTTRYGYIEARVKMPGAIGAWSAFWLNPDVSEAGTAAWPPEIDVFEFVNNGVEDTTSMLHTGVIDVPGKTSTFTFLDPAFNTKWAFWSAPFRFNEAWHTVATEWTPTTVSTFIDGKKVMTKAYEWKDKNGDLGGPAHILLNLAVGGSWAGRHGVDDAAFPQTYQINWIRAYKKM